MILVIIIIIVLIILLFIYKKNIDKFNNIPKKIYLSYKTKDIPKYIIPNIKKIYPDYEIELYDDKDCIKFLKKNYGQLYVDIFNFLKDGPIKADFWRLCILYKYGGIYFDIDLEHIKNINEIINDDTYFTSIIIDPSYRDNKRDFNPAIIKTGPKNNIIKECINICLEKYNKKINYDYWEYSIVTIMSKVLYSELQQEINKDGVYYDNNKNKYQFLLEKVPNRNGKAAYIEYDKEKYCNSRYTNYNGDTHNF